MTSPFQNYLTHQRTSWIHAPESKPDVENTISVIEGEITKLNDNGDHEYNVIIDKEEMHFGINSMHKCLFEGENWKVGDKFKITTWRPERGIIQWNLEKL